ncbi:MAG: hypothetical protein IPH09_11105 [bacterium]|nr:hypothetical protein [bacterium]
MRGRRFLRRRERDLGAAGCTVSAVAGGEYRTYLARGVVRNLFRGWNTLHHRQHMPLIGENATDGPRAGLIELVARRRWDQRRLPSTPPAPLEGRGRPDLPEWPARRSFSKRSSGQESTGEG